VTRVRRSVATWMSSNINMTTVLPFPAAKDCYIYVTMFCILKTTNHRSTLLNSTVHYFSSADNKLTITEESTLRLTQRLGKKRTYKFRYKIFVGTEGSEGKRRLCNLHNRHDNYTAASFSI
jgi:hypothetical protein